MKDIEENLAGSGRTLSKVKVDLRSIDSVSNLRTAEGERVCGSQEYIISISEERSKLSKI